MPGERDQRSVSNGSSTIQASIDLPCLPIGCSVSAKYRGAFCSAQVKSIDKQIRVKVKLIESGETIFISDEDIVQENCLHRGKTVTVRIPTSTRDHSSASKSHLRKQAIIKQITDNSIYTVVFNDGDETSLRRASLCLQGIRLYQNQIGQSKKNQEHRSSSSSKVSIDSNDENPVVCVRRTVNNEDQAFPALVLKRKALPDYLWVRSFLDGNEYVVHQHNDVENYRNNSEMQNLCRLTSKQATQACDRFLRYQQIPAVWQRKRSRHQSSMDSSDEDLTGTATDDDNEDETTEEKDAFLAKLLAFLDNRGSPINNIPKVHNYDLDLHRLFKIVLSLGGSNKVVSNVTKNQLWPKVHRKMGLPEVSSGERGRTIEQFFKKYLLAFEKFTKKLGTSDSFVSSRTKSNSDSRRSLIRRRSKTVDEIERPRKKSSSELSTRNRRTSSSSSSEKSNNLQATKRNSPQLDDLKLKPIVQISKISSETLENLSLNNDHESSADSIIERTDSSSTPEVPSIFQSLLFSASNENPNNFSPPSNARIQTNNSEINNDIRLKFDEISINDQLLIRENEDDLQYVFCVEKNDSNQEIRVSSQLDHSTDGTNSRWIPISRVLQRQLIVQIDPIQSNSYFSTDEDKLNQKQENFTENFTSTENPPIASDSEHSSVQKRSTPLKRALIRETRHSRDGSTSTRNKNKVPFEFSVSTDETSPSEMNKRQKCNSKRFVKRTTQQTENFDEQIEFPLNNQLRQKLEEMFNNRPSRYDFLDLNKDEKVSGDQRLENLKDRLRQCQQVFFNLRLALTKIDSQRKVFLRQKLSTTPNVEN